jgi:hypothetical protein
MWFGGKDRRRFDNWRQSLKCQYLKPRGRFTNTIERHWHGIATHRKPENKVSVLQRRAHGPRDEEYLRLKVLTFMLPAL